MTRSWHVVTAGWAGTAAVLFLLASVLLHAGEPKKKPAEPAPPPSPEFAQTLKDVPCRIVYETFRDGNWELFSVKADGSDPVNLTQTPNANELYPHVSPDGTKVGFVVDEFEEGAKQPKARSAWTMNIDGTGRTKVADGIREACWKADGTALALLPCEFERFTYEDYATKGVRFYDLKTGQITDHANKELYHLYNLCWSPDGKWLVATVHGGMGYKHTILAFEADGTKVTDLKIPGCRPDLSPDGKKIAWGASDWELCVADIDFGDPGPRVSNRRAVVKSAEPIKIYHIDWSPDGKCVAFSRGPEKKNLGFAPEMIGIKAAGWNLGVADANGSSVWTEITTDGNCNKEPDWAPAKAPAAANPATRPKRADGAAAPAAPAWLKDIPYRIVFETFRENNWELFMVNADGSNPVNLTKTPDVNEMYPHVSPDGSKISFLVNAGKGEATRRSAWLMNIDGTGRLKVADDVREVCWNGDGTALAILKAEFPNRYVHEDYATKGLAIYDPATGKIADHPNKNLHHLLGLYWSPDSQWFLATVYGGMGYGHTSLAFAVRSTKVFDLHITGCRPDLTLDGKRVAWGSSVAEISIGDMDLTPGKPAIVNRKVFVQAGSGMKVYHVDWSPDGKTVAFSRGPEQPDLGPAPEQLGVKARGWNLCVGNAASGEWAAITTDGNSNKEPDWTPAPKGGGT